MDEIVSLPFEHPVLHELKKSYLKIHTVIEKELNKLSILGNQAIAKHERPQVLRSIYLHPLTYYKLNGNNKVNQKDSFDFMTTCDYILNSTWL